MNTKNAKNTSDDSLPPSGEPFATQCRRMADQYHNKRARELQESTTREAQSWVDTIQKQASDVAIRSGAYKTTVRLPLPAENRDIDLDKFVQSVITIASETLADNKFTQQWEMSLTGDNKGVWVDLSWAEAPLDEGQAVS